MISFFANRGEFKAVSAITFIFTARIGRMGKVMFSQVSVRSQVRGIPQSQVLSQVFGPRSFPRGEPESWLGRYPSPDQGGGVPQDRIPPWPGQDWGTPQLGLGYPASWDWVRPPPRPPRQNSRASTCGMPLAVTQEDFPVFRMILANYLPLIPQPNRNHF